MGVQIGDRNVQDIRLDSETIFAAVDKSAAMTPEKQEAKTLWQKVIDSPILSRIIGSIVGSG
jgi:hypothetical protein